MSPSHQDFEVENDLIQDSQASGGLAYIQFIIASTPDNS